MYPTQVTHFLAPGGRNGTRKYRVGRERREERKKKRNGEMRESLCGFA